MRLAVRVILFGCVLCLPFPATAGMVFHVGFDNNEDGSLNGPLVGCGQLSFSNNLADGSYQLTSLNDVAFSFSFGSETVTQADTVNFSPGTEIVIFNSGTAFYFNGNGQSTSTGGSVEVFNGNGFVLAFQPNWYSPPPYIVYGAGYGGQFNYSFGEFGASNCPEPATWVLAATGSLFGLLAAKRRQSKRVA